MSWSWQNLLNTLTHRSHVVAGIDISASSIKFLELSKRDQSYQVEAYATVPLLEGAVENGEFKDISAVSQAVAVAKKAAKSKAQSAVLAVHGSAIISKIVPMDNALTDLEQEEYAKLEASHFVPFPIDEVNLDFVKLSQSSEKATDNSVLIVASRKENVNTRIDVLEEAGLKTKIIDVDSYAIGRVCCLLCNGQEEKEYGDTIAIIDIGKTMTNMTVLHENAIAFTREETFGGHDITLKIQSMLNVSYNEAVGAKKFGYLSEKNTPKQVDDSIFQVSREMICQYVNRLLQFYFASNHSEVAHIFLAGGSVNVPGLVEYIESRLKVSCEIANPFRSITLSKNVDPAELNKNASSLLLCCGLAMRGCDEC